MGKSDSSGTGQHDLPVQGWSHGACFTGAFNSGLLIWKVQITLRATIQPRNSAVLVKMAKTGCLSRYF